MPVSTVPPAAPPVPYAEFAEDVEAVYGLKAKKTASKVRQVVREIGAVVHPTTGRQLVETTADLKPRTIAYWRQAYPDRKPATVHSLMRSLRSACAVGVASGYWPANPLALATLWPDVAATEEDEAAEVTRHHPIADIQRVLLKLQEEAVFSWHAHRLYTLASLVALTGVRKMEALRLHVGDLDLDTPCVRIKARRKLKTRASAAPVGMPAELVEIVRWWLPRLKGRPIGDGPWLFPGATGKSYWDGGPPGQRPLDRLKAAGQKVGVGGFTFQSLRHSWATHAEYWGLGETLIQRQLRHTSPKTQQRYRHADAENLARSVAPISYGLRMDAMEPSLN